MFNDPQFWILVAFIIFSAAVFKPIKKNISSSLDNKIKEIKNSIEQAENIKKETQVTLSEIKKRQDNITYEIEKIQNKAKERITFIKNNSNLKLNQQIKKRNQLAKTKIEQLVRDTNIQIQNYVIHNTIQATIKILEKKLNQSEKQNLVNSSIEELNSVLKH